MAKTYNINTFGTLTNTDGVLSDFSTTNYATINSTITYTNTFELNFKVTTSSDVSNLQIICCPDVDQEGVRLDISGGKFEFLCGKNGSWFNLANYQGGTVQANTTYYLKATYNGSAYKLEVSTDGNSYSTVISFTSTNQVTSSFTNYILGIYSDFTLGVFSGSIDLNACSISTNDIRVWKGVTNVGTTIQLRRDTATNWTFANPILAEGEVGIETDTNQQKIGDGITAWDKLPYLINYDSFDAPMVDYVAQTGTTWDETKLVYNSTSKVFTPTDTVSAGLYEYLHPVTFNIPADINIDAYNDMWAVIIPNGTFTVNSTNISNLTCYEIYAEDGNVISKLWYGASAWRKGMSASTAYVPSGSSWHIEHAYQNDTHRKGYNSDNLSQSCTFLSTAGRINKIVVYVNSQMNINVPVGGITLNRLDSNYNIIKTYTLFTEGSQPRVKLNYNTNNLTINASGQLDTTSDLSSFLTGITSSDVITALGYTPVNKAGDTMTGNLTVPQLNAGVNQCINIGQDSRINLIMSNVSKGSTPSSQQYQAILINDGDSNHTTWQSKRLSGIEGSVTDTGESKITITAYKNEADSTSRSSFVIGYGSSAYCTFPNTTCVDGQWVSKSLSAWSNATLPTTDHLELDLRDAENPYLPTDDDYEIIVDAIAYTSSSVVDAPSIVALYGGRFIERIIAVKTLNANQSNRQAGMAIIPITKTFHKLRVNADANNLGNFSLQIRGYRRTGTNT